MVTLCRDHTASQAVQRRAQHFCVDNSMSMGRNTQRAMQHFAQLLDGATEPSSLTLFCERAQLMSDNLRTAAQMNALPLPAQGRTNISAGLERMVDCVVAAEAQAGVGQVHHVMVLLTDGAHNEGPRPEAEILRIRQKLPPGVLCSMVVVGVTNSSKTKLGMIAKTALETVAMDGLEPIYFCETASEMSQILVQLQQAFSRFDNAELTTLKSESRCSFVRDLAGPPTATASVCLEPGAVCGLLMEGPLPDSLVIDGVQMAVQPTAVDTELMIEAVGGLMNKLRQRRVADADDASVRAQGAALDVWINVLEAQLQMQSSVEPAAEGAPHSRLRRLKKTKTELNTAQQLRNQLASVLAFRSDSSSSQASFLSGATCKFAAKALIRANQRSEPPTDRMGQLRAEVRRVAAALPRALRKDALHQLRLLEPTEQRALGLDQAVLQLLLSGDCDELCDDSALSALLDEQLPSAIDSMKCPSTSWLSLLSHREQLQEWIECADSLEELDTEYEMLCFVGMIAHPIQVSRCDATQMNPYQMSISRVLSSPVDSASVMTALKCDERLRAPEGGYVTDVLALIDPMLPHASRLVCRSQLMDTLVSVTLCRDLNMFQGNEQRMALHAHALVSVLSESPTLASTKLALKMVYSARQHLGAFAQSDECRYVQLIKRLLEWESLTAADGVDHTAQLLLAMSMLDRQALQLPALTLPALYNLCNETLARQARLQLKGTTDGESAAMQQAASGRVIARLAINEASCPHPMPVEQSEPLRKSVIEQCEAVRPSYSLSSSSQSAQFCEAQLSSVVVCVQFAEALQAFAAANGGMENTVRLIEQDSDELARWMMQAVAQVPDVASFLEMGAARETIMTTMEAQAFLFHTSAKRYSLSDVRDAATLDEMAVQMRMEMYDVAVAQKMREWNKIAGSVTAQRAMACDDKQFASLVGRHAHGLGSQEFWAIARIAKRAGGNKRATFLNACNDGVSKGRRFHSL